MLNFKFGNKVKVPVDNATSFSSLKFAELTKNPQNLTIRHFHYDSWSHNLRGNDQSTVEIIVCNGTDSIIECSIPIPRILGSNVYTMLITTHIILVLVYILLLVWYLSLIMLFIWLGMILYVALHY